MRTSVIALLLLSACSPAAQTQAPAPAKPTVDLAAAETEVRSFVETYNGYYGANDMDRYFSTFDKGLTQWYPSGRVSLESYEKSWRANIANGGGNAAVKVEDLVIQVGPSGDAAVATYVLNVTPRVAGKATTTLERNQETDVMFKRDGQWKVVHVNYAPAKPAKP